MLFARKNCVLVVVALFYSIGSSGIALQAHFCRGEFHSVEFASIDTPAGCGCQKKSESCCKDVTGYFAIEDDQFGTSGCAIPQVSYAVFDFFHSRPYGLNYYVPKTYCYYPVDDPPKESGLPIYLLIRNLRN